MSSADLSPTAATDSNAPLLRSRQGSSESPTASPATLALLLGRASGRRGASMLVRETAARELEDRRADWGYSKPVVALDMMWNIAFVVVSIVMVICTLNEHPNTPIRLWICGYALQCMIHVVLVWLEYRRRTGRRVRDSERQQQQQGEYINDSGDEDVSEMGFGVSSRSSFAKRCESVNTVASFLWWIVGFYWVVAGGGILIQNAPRLYWLAVIFLALDVFFAIFCVILACLIGIALCCCLPCIIAILYAVAGQEGASEADLSTLPKYRFQLLDDNNKPNVGAGKMVPMETSSGYLVTECILLPEDAMKLFLIYALVVEGGTKKGKLKDALSVYGLLISVNFITHLHNFFFFLFEMFNVIFYASWQAWYISVEKVQPDIMKLEVKRFLSKSL